MYPLVKHKLQFRRYPLEYLLEFRFSLLFLLRLKLPESFLTMEDETLVHYYCSQNFNADAERGIRYNDPFFKFKWPIDQPLHISEKDATWPNYDSI